MSKCLECGREMHPLDAQEYEECGVCRKGKKAAKVKSMYRRSPYDSPLPVENSDVLRRGELSAEIELARRRAEALRGPK